MQTTITASSSSSKAAGVAGGTKTPCWAKVGLKRELWTPEEDELLINYIKKEWDGRWRTLPKRAGNDHSQQWRLFCTDSEFSMRTPGDCIGVEEVGLKYRHSVAVGAGEGEKVGGIGGGEDGGVDTGVALFQ
ncbi:hypothetical protein ACFX13_017618 [Malus domestica]